LREEAIAAVLDTASSAAALDTASNGIVARHQASGLGRDLAVARRVIRAEIDGLEKLSQTLDSAFGIALDLCAAARGRLIVTGIGKSGHVGRKIAATLASTGTPAQFVHPAEASHGDLGMIGVDDAILALSNSGESDQLAAILVMTAKSFGCVGVCDADGRLLGVITDGDLRRHMDDRLLARTVAEIMHRNPKTISAAHLAAEALGVMNQFAITALFVVDDAE